MSLLRKSMAQNLKRTTAMSIEKSTPSEEKPSLNYEQDDKGKFEAVKHSTRIERYHDSFQAAFDPLDPTLLWKLEIPFVVGVKKRHVTFKDTTYIISNWTEDEFPNCIYIILEGAIGFLTKDRTQTNRVAALELSQVETVIDASDVRTYELVYKISDPVTVEIPVATAVLPYVMKFRLKIDQSEDNLVLPLPNPLSLNLEVRSE